MAKSKPYRGTPAFWARPDVARIFLVCDGWKVGARRATRWSGENIPAPQEGDLYDLHDIACVKGLGGTQMVQKIREWATGAYRG